MLSRKCTGQFFQVLPGAGGGEGWLCPPGSLPGSRAAEPPSAWERGRGAKLVFRGILAGLTKRVCDTGCLQKHLGTAGPFPSCIPVFYVTRGGGVALPGLLFATSFPFPSKPFPGAAGSRADSHKHQKPLETGGGFLT